jgi:spore photoproduct lyase
MWNENSIIKLWDDTPNQKYQGKKLKSILIETVKQKYNQLKNSPTNYKNFNQTKIKAPKIKLESQEKKSLGFGLCPVASPKTRCCNLLTLDAVESCGFDCSYCSIQSFYNEGKITFDTSLKEKLANIQLDPDEFYHIGTGQSSDSMMWGNQFGVLDELVEFARKNPNIMLEFKTKSNKISYFLEQDNLPKNLLFTWSLNPQIIIDHEEHLTASLDQRLEAAKKLHDKGCLVGFHFHPMIHIKNWKDEYGDIFKKMIEMFDPKKVALVSFGTLTFIKPVLKQIRARDFKTKILQIPLTEASGKFSYPLEIKQEMFKFAYDSFTPWHKDVYFYLCMEDHSLWKKIFGYEYPTNESFEMDMKLHYITKISRYNNN